MNLQNENTQEITLRELIDLFFSKWKFISAITLFFAIISVIYAISLPNIYTSKALLSKTNNDQSAMGMLSQFSGMASLAGISLPSDSGDRSIEAIEKVKSFEFFKNNFLPYINLHDLLAVDDWDHETNTLIYDEKSYDSIKNQWIRKVSYPKKTIPSAQEAYKTYKVIMNIDQDIKTSFISLTVEHNSPYIAKEWADTIISEINNNMKEKDKISALKSIDFLNNQLPTVNYAEVREAISKLQQEQMKQLMLIESNKDYILTVLDSPYASELKSSPNRALICFSITLFGFILSLLAIVLRNHKTH
tara:strand:- start:10477 stop:11388 length:912 start_codon:yes stop_codon:yes gene_type:complete